MNRELQTCTLFLVRNPYSGFMGDMERVKYKVLKNDELKAMLYEIAPENKIKVFEETGDVDFAYEIPNLARYRANYFQQKWGVGAVFREIPSTILTSEQLGLPKVITKLSMLHKDLGLALLQPDRSGRSGRNHGHHPQASGSVY